MPILKNLHYLENTSNLDNLDSLQKLNQLNQLNKLDNLKMLNKLSELENLKKLDSINLKGLQHLDSLKHMPDLSTLQHLDHLENLNKLDKLDKLDAIIQRLDVATAPYDATVLSLMLFHILGIIIPGIVFKELFLFTLCGKKAARHGLLLIALYNCLNFLLMSFTVYRAVDEIFLFGNPVIGFSIAALMLIIMPILLGVGLGKLAKRRGLATFFEVDASVVVSVAG